VRVGHLRSHIEAEVFLIVVIDLVSNSDLHNASLGLVSRFKENGVESRIQEFLNILNKDWFSSRGGLSKCPLKILGILLKDVKVIFFLKIFNPFISLLLRVNHEWPS
jgi:hypothetical protein